jgi:acyl-CoA synthetase (NDP forming)
LRVTALAAETMEKLRAFLPPSASVANPVDMIASASADHYRRTVELVLADPNVDSLLTIFIPPIVTAASDVADAIRSASADCRKPVLATFMGVPGGLMMAPIPTYIFPESAAVALARVTRYGEWLRRPHAEPPQLDTFDRDEVRRLVTSALAEGGGWMEPAHAQALLDACGVSIARARTAKTADEAVQAACALGYPVVLKALGATLLHKTDVGGVKLGLADESAVRDAFGSLQRSLGNRLEGVLVQQMLPAGVEMVVGGINDPALGPVIMGGTGGVLVELFADTVFRMCPLTDADAQEMVDEMKGRALLRGYRGATPADEAAFLRVLLAISQLLDACPEIHEMDINPIIVATSGATAVDVRIRVGTPASPSPQARRISY